MSAEYAELPVSEARDHFSDVVNRANYGGEITWVTRGRNRLRAAAIVPAWVVEAYEELLDREDGRIASERLSELHSGSADTLPADEVAKQLGL
jgi:prevent-host-death family protein